MKIFFLTLFASALGFASLAQSGCQAFFEQDSTSQCPTFQFYDLSTSNQPIVSWSYNFGDGAYSSSASPSHTYTSNGVYTVFLTTLSSDSCYSSFCSTVTVNCLGQTGCIDPTSIDTNIFCPQVIGRCIV